MTFWQGMRNLLLALARLLPTPGLWAAVALPLIAVRVAVGYADGLVPLTLVVDGVSRPVRSRCITVGDVLGDLGVVSHEWDRVYPDPPVAIRPRMRIEVQHARVVTLVADGTTRTIHTYARQVEAILAEAGVNLKMGDQLWVNGELVGDARPAGSALPIDASVRPASMGRSRRAQDVSVLSSALHVEVRRATLFYVSDGSVQQPVRTTATTLGQALAESGIVLYLGDRIYPDLNTSVHAGLRVRIERGVPVSVLVDGRTIRTRTHSKTVGSVLAELGVSLVGRDFVAPEPGDRIYPGLQIQVSRVVEKQVVEEKEIAFETEWLPDASLELDHRRVDAAGANGIQRRRYRVVYQDGIEIERRLEDE